ncbi:MAG: VWA domain-containing protein [Actinomycetota bacterium]|nr:VWA domain-containing protein [Actinomycetota bacterium]MDQ6947057.1 VWA domain-containing protein [Actinomycetota bacterium]
MTTFTANTYQNEYLADGEADVNAVVTVTASGATETPEVTDAAEIIIVDISGSMNYPPTKLRAAQRATAAAIDCIREGVWFAVIAGTKLAHQVYPAHGTLAPASPFTREEAKRAVAGLQAQGGTAIGAWLALANQLFATVPASINHAILLTDGKDESEMPADLERALASCQGRFQCDCRGVGTDWVVSELRKVASALLGTVDIVADPAQLTADFTAMVEQAMGKATADVALRVWTPQTASVSFVKQVAPALEDLSDKRRAVNDRVGDYPTGAWGDESRDYHLCVKVRPGAVGDEMLAARVSLMVGDQVVSQALVRAVWTDDAQLSTRINRAVAHYTGQAELAQVIQEGLEARKAGDDATATVKLGRAAQLAAASGNEATTKLLSKVVDVEDAATGTVRLKSRVEDADEMALDTRSTKTVRVTKSGS